MLGRLLYVVTLGGMSPLLGLVLVLATFPVFLIVVGVRQLHTRGKTDRVPVEAVVQDAPLDYHEKWMIVSYAAPDGSEVIGETREGFTGAKAGDPITVWIDPTDPNRFSIAAPPTGAGMAFVGIGVGLVMLILLYRFFALN